LNVWGVVLTTVQVIGVINAAHAVMNVRSSSSALAWAVLLSTVPWIAVPAYWVLGRTRFNGYGRALREAQNRYRTSLVDLLTQTKAHTCELPPPLEGLERTLAKLLPVGFTAGNRCQVLIDGEAIYAAMLADIAQAQRYILLQVYILKGDAVGERFLQALSERAAAGVAVCLLYDEIGSFELPDEFINRARRAGLQTSGFKTTRGPGNRLQINFRNHRKILVVDGLSGYCGGVNIGVEYLGQDPQLGAWRDTHMRLEGPAVKVLQTSFLADWYWATGGSLRTDWSVPQPPQGSGGPAAVVCTGPSDVVDLCGLFYQALFATARRRLWISSPYLVPDRATLAALKGAALRGADVRILVPLRTDHLVPRLCSLSYYDELKHVGIQLFHYKRGFLHQKVVLVDNQLAVVGSVNLDNRSFHLNFEATVVSAEQAAIEQLEAALRADLEGAQPADLDTYGKQRLPKRILIRLTRLLSGQL
jgi:cardiolipin synthase A/B